MSNRAKIISTILLFLLYISTGRAQVRIEKALVTPDDISNMIKYEKLFSERDSGFAPADSSWFRYITGTGKVLFTAPHTTSQIREGKIKDPDPGTGSLAIILNKLKKVPVLFTTYTSPSDPNYYDDNDFKKKLSEIIDSLHPVIVIDLHTSNSSRPYDVDFGTMRGISYLQRKDLLDSLSIELYTNGLINQSMDFFPAASHQTVTKFVYNKNVPCIQLEINSNFLSPEKGDIYKQNASKLLQSLIRFIDDVE